MAVAISKTEPLSPSVRRGLLALVIFFHVGGVWALTKIRPDRIVVGDVRSLEVSFVERHAVAAPRPPRPEPESAPEPPQLESMVPPPVVDAAPPVFPVPPPPPPKPQPPQPKPQQATPAAPVAPSAPPAAAPVQAAAPKTVPASQLTYINPPNPTYPARSRRAGEKGSVTIRVLVDGAGQPTQASVEASSGHAALDEAALNAVKAARFRPYAESGIPQPVWVLVPINFVLQ